jgi:hypothetical protein
MAQQEPSVFGLSGFFGSFGQRIAARNNKTHEINQMNYTNQDSFNILLDNLLIGEL